MCVRARSRRMRDPLIRANDTIKKTKKKCHRHSHGTNVFIDERIKIRTDTHKCFLAQFFNFHSERKTKTKTNTNLSHSMNIPIRFRTNHFYDLFWWWFPSNSCIFPFFFYLSLFLILQKVVKAMGKSWHEDHFVCGGPCKKPMSGTPFFEREGKPYCKADFEKLFAAKCEGCSNPITENTVIALNAKWHKDCFKCKVTVFRFCRLLTLKWNCKQTEEEKKTSYQMRQRMNRHCVGMNMLQIVHLHENEWRVGTDRHTTQHQQNVWSDSRLQICVFVSPFSPNGTKLSANELI